MSWSRLLAQIIKELLCLWRDPRSRMTLIAPPLVQLLVFSFAATQEVRNITLALEDRDGGMAAVELVARIQAAGFVGQLLRLDPGAPYQDRIDQRQVLAMVVIPPGFSADLAAGRGASVQVIVDGRRANAGQVTVGYLTSITSQMGAELTGADHEPAMVRHWFNPNLIYRWFIVPSLIGTLSAIIALIITSLSIARERELGTFDQLLVSPTGPGEIILAKMIPAVLVGGVLGLVMVGAAVLGFGVPFTGSFSMLFVSLLLFILSMVGVGLMISAICNTQQQAILGAVTVLLPMVMMSGFATPVENMPWILQILAQGIPLTHFLVIVQGSFLKALPVLEVAQRAWPLAVIGGVTLAAAVLFVRGRLQ